MDCQNVYSGFSFSGFLFFFLFSMPDSCLLVGFLKYPEVIFGDGREELLLGRLDARGQGGARRRREERNSTLKGKSAGVCDEMRCEVFPHSEPADT